MTSEEFYNLRKSTGLSQAEFAKLIHKTRSYVSKVERGFHHVTTSMEYDIKNRIADYSGGKIQISRNFSSSDDAQPVECPECGKSFILPPTILQPQIVEPEDIQTIKDDVNANGEKLVDVLKALEAFAEHDKKIREREESKTRQISSICQSHARLANSALKTLATLITNDAPKNDALQILAHVAEIITEMAALTQH